MAFDGITVSAIKAEIEDKILGGRIDKVYQPEKDEIILGIRSMGQAYKLLLTSNASNPKFHFTQTNPSNPMTPPLFCMVMRKHLQSGKIIKIEQPDFDRILNIYVESLNELGDYSVKKLVLEIMGRHSNIILTDENNTILDCIKHIGHDTSSVREVLPGREYTLPPSQGKINTLELDNNNFNEVLENNPSFEIQSVIYKNYTGISPIAASEICYRANVNGSTPVEALTDIQKEIVFNKFAELVEDIKANRFYPENITNEKGKTIDFSPIEMTQFNGLEIKKYTSISELIESFYANRDFAYRIGQKTQDLRKLITQNIERCIRKKDIQMQTLRSIKNRDELRLKGELLTANIYSIKKGMTTVELPNYYSENQELVAIELDSNKTPSENAQKYYKAYNKAKRTFEALKDQIKSNDEELAYLESVLTSVNNCTDEQDVKEIRRELREEGYVKKVKNQKDKSKKHSVPLHFISQDGFDIYVGKNNIQNDELTLKFARPRDIWMHTKNIPGSHVIIVANGQTIPDTTLNEGAMLSAFYSKAKNSSKVPVDYTEKKNVKKPNGSKPGFVIYETNKTAYITTSEEEIKKIRRGD
jgi:predicted ribosome quality control (RQC) complex YloA/Tae2 family protein